jgi:hypothetical protein
LAAVRKAIFRLKAASIDTGATTNFNGSNALFGRIVLLLVCLAVSVRSALVNKTICLLYLEVNG